MPIKKNVMFARSASDPVDQKESARLSALDRLDVLDTPRDETFDRITRLVKNIFGTEIAAVSMIDSHRQWYKSSEGLAVTETARQNTFCRHTIESTLPLVIRDTNTDSRFMAHPSVTGNPHVRFYAGAPLTTHDGHNVGTVCAIGYKPRMFSVVEEQILTDLAQIAMDQLELQQVASIDSLTGALTRRAFKQESELALALASRHRHSLACISFDLDFFKSINDTYGHAGGDTVLVGVANAVKAQLRKTDVLGRLGGEEFSVILPQTDRDGALAVAEKLRAVVEDLDFPLNGKNVRVTASFGVSTLSLVTKDIDSLLATADAALYRAKSDGRNRCVLWASSVAEDGTSGRRRVLKAGQILFNNRRSTIDCTIRSLSERDAGIDVSTSTGIPSDFALVIRSEGFETQCRVVSQTEKHVEVEFV